jgi:hypothetical protein
MRLLQVPVAQLSLLAAATAVQPSPPRRGTSSGGCAISDFGAIPGNRTADSHTNAAALQVRASLARSQSGHQTPNHVGRAG